MHQFNEIKEQQILDQEKKKNELLNSQNEVEKKMLELEKELLVDFFCNISLLKNMIRLKNYPILFLRGISILTRKF
jgi:hypothetical protein